MILYLWSCRSPRR